MVFNKIIIYLPYFLYNILKNQLKWIRGGIYLNFLCNLEFLMDRNNINRSELAKAIGIAPSTINAWYTKDYKGITLKNLSKLASFFDISMEALVYGDQSSLTFTLENYTEAELKAIYDFSQYIKEKRSSE